ncbi:hypothetical protein M514_26312 [Trichuris suis]|uniref:Uncharacterized protein n=1 Tax=Trichuris suis TaxID=68888 RepID=A0A085MWA3_9BILA|nr:hypothetical protein M514_26312 [Trichuris suis]
MIRPSTGIAPYCYVPCRTFGDHAWFSSRQMCTSADHPRGEKTLPRSRQMVRLNRAAHYCQMGASWNHSVADRNKAIAISPGGPKS